MTSETLRSHETAHWLTRCGPGAFHRWVEELGTAARTLASEWSK